MGNPRSVNQTPVMGICDLQCCWKNPVGDRKFPIFPALPKYAMKPAVLKRKRDKYPLENSPSLNEKTAFRRFPRTKPDVPSLDLIMHITLRENLQGRQSNTSKLSNQFLIPSSVSHSSRRSVSERWSPSRPIPTRPPINRQSDPIVNR